MYKPTFQGEGQAEKPGCLLVRSPREGEWVRRRKPRIEPRDSTCLQGEEPRRNLERRWRGTAREGGGNPRSMGTRGGREGFKEEGVTLRKLKTALDVTEVTGHVPKSSCGDCVTSKLCYE